MELYINVTQKVLFMRVLWINPSFLDYRIPLYKELNDLLKGSFNLIYSKNRIPDRCHNKIKAAIGENAVSLDNEKRFSFGNNSDFANASVSIPYPKGLYQLIKSTSPDVVIAEGFFQFTPWAVIYCLLNKKPLLIAYERTQHTERNCPFWRKLYRKFINLFVDGYIVNGILTKEYLISQGVKENVIFTGAMCADSEGLAKSIQRLSKDDKIQISIEKSLDRVKGLIYLYVGQLVERKGVRSLLSAWNKHLENHNEDVLLIVGSGPLEEEFHRDFANVESIRFYGNVDYSEIYQFYAISDVFVIPTLEDNWSLVVPEAMACGLPIACSIYNGCHPELVHKDINGITFDPLKEDSLIHALDYFHHGDLSEFGKKSMEIEQKFNPVSTAKNIYNALKHFF